MAAPHPTLPTTMRAWQYSSAKDGIENNLYLNPSAPLPIPKPNQHVIQVIACALNPIDHKVAEIPVIGPMVIHKNAIPGIDCAGRIIVPASTSHLIAGDLIFGAAGTGSPLVGGACGAYAVVQDKNAARVPEGVDPVDAATIGIAGLTAYQSIVTRVTKGAGQRVFINGGSGGVGCFGIQMAKAMGCHVTVTCSGANAQLCRDLGADEVIDYTTTDVIATLAAGEKFDHAVDNVGMDVELCYQCHRFLKKGKSLVVVGGAPTLSNLKDAMVKNMLPRLFGGVRGKTEPFWPRPKIEDLNQIAEWMREGRIRAVIDGKYAYVDAVKAFERLKTKRARGKIVILGPVEDVKREDIKM